MTKVPTRTPTRTPTSSSTKQDKRAFTPSTTTPTLAFELLTGNYFSFQYSHLMNIDFIPSEGIILRFTAVSFKIKGRSLRTLYMALLEHSVKMIHVTDDIPENQTEVTAIELLIGTHEMFTPMQSE